MFAILLRLASMAPAHIAPQTVPGLMSDLVTATADMSGTVEEMALAATFATCEGGGLQHVIGDGGAAVGTTQLHEEHWHGYSRADVLGSRVLQIELWILSLREATERYGSTEKALRAIASGSPNGAKALVRRRMAGKC